MPKKVRRSVDGKFIGDKPVDRIREGLKVAYREDLETCRRLARGERDPWMLNPAKKVG